MEMGEDKLVEEQNEAKHKKAIWAWTMYDWANSAFATTIMASILPAYFSTYIDPGNSVAIWGSVVAIGSGRGVD